MVTLSAFNDYNSLSILEQHSWLDLKGELTSYCIQVIGLVKRLEELHWPTFSEKEDGCTVLMSSITAIELLKIIEMGIKNDELFTLKMPYNPYLACFLNLLKSMKYQFDVLAMLSYSKIKILNYSVYFLKRRFLSKEVMLLKYKQKKAYRNRIKSACSFIESIQSNYSRILCIRIDLTYRKGMFLESNSFFDQMKSVKSDWQKMRTRLAGSKLGDGVIGYLLKLEYGVLKGFHYHALIIYNGSKHQQDVVLGKVLGDCWVNEVVDNGNGRYFNCNRYKHKYKYLGIGTINYYEKDKYRNLIDLVIGYMIKSDDVLDFVGPNERFFFKSIINKTVRPVRGRPRNKNI